MNYRELRNIPDSGLDAFRPKPTIPRDLFVELTANIAKRFLDETFGGDVIQRAENGDLHFTEAAQDEFNNYYDLVSEMLERILEVEDI